ncbi:MAG: hypothetical protein ACFNLP_01625, partial [Segatella oulorum]
MESMIYKTPIRSALSLSPSSFCSIRKGFIGAAGSMVSKTAIGAVDLTQIIGIAGIDGVNHLTGGKTPEWMK